jgi:hypothetical protein
MQHENPRPHFRIVIAACLPLLGAPNARPQEAINLGKLRNTVVDASSVNGGRALDNEFYGLQNLFDGGKNVINGINYTYWLSDSATRHWIKLRFDAPVEIRSIMLEFNAKTTLRGAVPIALAEADRSATHELASRRPEEFAIDVTRRADGEGVVQKLASVPVTGFRVFYPLEKPLPDVIELTLIFPGPSMIEVAEIEVMGTSSQPADGIGEGPKVAARE